jgi:hypothetical protein
MFLAFMVVFGPECEPFFIASLMMLLQFQKFTANRPYSPFNSPESQVPVSWFKSSCPISCGRSQTKNQFRIVDDEVMLHVEHQLKNENYSFTCLHIKWKITPVLQSWTGMIIHNSGCCKGLDNNEEKIMSYEKERRNF